MKSRIALMICACLLGLAQSGCNNGTSMTDIYSNNIKKLHACYMMFMTNNGNVGPKSEEEFKTYLKTEPTAVHILKRMEITPDVVDDLFISERDGEPFEIRYGLKGEADHAIIFEKTGVDGNRLIAFYDVKPYGSQEYDDWLNGKAKAKKSSDAEEMYEEELDEDEIVPAETTGG